MHPETIETITQRWNSITPKRQRELIWSYLCEYNTTDTCRWMDFLLSQFKLDDPSDAPAFQEHVLPN